MAAVKKTSSTSGFTRKGVENQTDNLTVPFLKIRKFMEQGTKNESLEMFYPSGAGWGNVEVEIVCAEY